MTSFYQSNLSTACSIPASLAASASFTCYGKLTWAAGQHSNTATATGTYNATPYSDTDLAHYFGTSAGKLPPTGSKTVDSTKLPELTWRMVWINSGNDTPLLTTISDTLASGTTYVNDSLTCEVRGTSTTTSCSYDSAAKKIVWLGTMGPDKDKTTESAASNELVITFKVTVSDSTNQVINKGSAVADTDGDGSLADETSSASKSETNEAKWDRVLIVVDPKITKSVSPSEGKTGETVTYTMVVTNSGSGTASNVVVTDTISSYLDISSVTTTKGSATFSGRTATFSVGAVAVGETVTLKITAKINAAATVSVDIPNFAVLSHNSFGVSASENSNVVYFRILAAKTLPNTGEGGPPVNLFTWLSYWLLAILGIGLIGYGLYRWYQTNASGSRQSNYPANKSQRLLTGAIPMSLGLLAWTILLGLYMVTWPANQVDKTASIDIADQPGASTPAGQPAQPGQPGQPGTAAEATPAAPEWQGATTMLPSGELVIVPHSTPEPPEPMPAYSLPVPPAEAEGLTGYPAVSGEPDSTPVIHILIPSIGVNTDVDFIPFDGTTWPLTGLRQQVAWLGDSSWPGLGSNTVLAGHVTLSGGILGPFNSLDKLKSGDKIYLSTEKYTYVYVYTDTMEVEPTDASVTDPTSSPQVTLITCTNWNSGSQVYDKRLVVTATLESVTSL